MIHIYANVTEDVLCAFLKEKVAPKILLKKKTGDETYTYVHPDVYKGYIMADNAENTEEKLYPFITVRCIKLFNGTKEQTQKRVYARVKIIFGVWCDGLEAAAGENGEYTADEELTPRQDGGGHTDLWDMMERTRLEIFERMVIGKKVSAEYEDFEMNIIEEQPVPYWHGYILLNVSMPEICPNRSFNKIFGEE